MPGIAKSEISDEAFKDRSRFLPMKISRLTPLLISFLSLFVGLTIVRALDDQPTVGLIPITPEIEAYASKALHGCEPKSGKSVGEINKNGVYTLTGDLFHNGRIFSIVDEADVVIVCEWKKSTWRPVSAINVATNWNFPDGYRERVFPSPYQQTKPFWMIELQNRPLLVIASDVEKAGQNYYVILFDAKCEKIMSFTSSFQRKPEVKEQYLLTGDASRNKADYEATYFLKIQNDKLVELKSWDDNQTWHADDTENMSDDSSNRATSDKTGYLILPDNSGDPHPADYLVYRINLDEEIGLPRSSDTVKGRSFVAIYFTPNKSQSDAETLIYLFQKLTGLPTDLFPSRDSDIMKTNNNPNWKIKVTGTDEALIKLLSPAPTQPKSNID